jgi:predicted transposase/invertase (TIGR01784 family)
VINTTFSVNEEVGKPYAYDDFVLPELLPPSEDGVFRTLLTHPEAKPILRDVVGSFLRLPVTNVEVRNAELPISDINEKRERFDVNCLIDDGSQVDVEMQSNAMKGDSQSTDHKIIKSRAVYNLCDLHSGQAGRGVRFDRLMRSYQMTFCGYTVFPGRGEFVRRFSFRDESGEELTDTISVIFVELTKLDDIVNKPVYTMTREEQWCIFFAFGGDPKHRVLIDELTAVKEEIKMAVELLKTISKDENERARFRSRRMFQMDMDHNLLASRDEGREEKAMEIARNLLKMKLSVEQIITATGLDREEVEKIATLTV